MSLGCHRRAAGILANDIISWSLQTISALNVLLGLGASVDGTLAVKYEDLRLHPRTPVKLGTMAGA